MISRPIQQGEDLAFGMGRWGNNQSDSVMKFSLQARVWAGVQARVWGLVLGGGSFVNAKVVARVWARARLGFELGFGLGLGLGLAWVQTNAGS